MHSGKALLRSAAIAGLVVCVVAGGFMWRARVRRQHDREVVAAFFGAARRGQDSRPCDVAVEQVAQVSQQAKALPAASCSPKPDAAEARRLADRYLNVAKAYDSIAAEVSRFDSSVSFAESKATSPLDEIDDPELKRAVADAQTALAKRDRVAATLLENWRKLSRATSDYAARVEAGLIRGDKAACAGLERGVAAKSPAEILVSCHREFNASRTELDAKLSQLERAAQR
jgi:hypothetical protein